MPLGQLTLEFIQRAAIRATRLAAVIERDRHLRVGIPQIRARLRASQWQVVRGDFDVTLGDVLFAHEIHLKYG